MCWDGLNDVLLYHSVCPVPCAWFSHMIQMVEQMAAELSRKLLKREDTALQYKRCVL